MLLNDKVAVIYGAGGGIGGAVALAFAREGAKLFLTGRQRAPVEVVAKEVVSAGGSADVAEVDALDERAVDKHLQSVIDKAGRVDISFNAVGIPNAKILGVPLTELDVEQFSLPITTLATSYFLTACLAARRMVANKSGVIMTVTATHSREGIPLVGGYGPAQAAKEALTRALSAELFTGRSQLLIYHFMFGPEYTAGCPSCSATPPRPQPSMRSMKRQSSAMSLKWQANQAVWT